MDLRNWTIFLDRDGVINRRQINTYLACWDNFEFIEKSDVAIVELSKKCNRLCVVTNQQGVAKGITTHFEIEHLHYRLSKHIETLGGLIDEIYYCPEHQIYDAPCRKPNPGMALQAKQDFPDVNFAQSIMVGDFYTDIQMGHSVGMKTVFIQNDSSEWQQNAPTPNYIFPSLWAFNQAIAELDWSQ